MELNIIAKCVEHPCHKIYIHIVQMNNFTVVLYNITPMFKMDGQFIDGEQASISCYDIIQSEASSLDLPCDNVTNIAQEENGDATLIRNVFTADLKDDNTICRCISNKSNSESMLNIHIFPCKFYFHIQEKKRIRRIYLQMI